MLATHGQTDLALSLFNATVINFQQHGIMECVNVGYHGGAHISHHSFTTTDIADAVVSYVDSATATYFAGKQLASILGLHW